MHVDDGGYVGIPEGPHTHSHLRNHREGTSDYRHGQIDSRPRADLHGIGQYAPGAHTHHDELPGETLHGHDGEHPTDHDYGDAKDVSLLELSGGAAKLVLVLALILLTVFVPLLTRAGPGGFADQSVRPLGSRRSRWRPPLRAPPLHA